MNTPPFFSICIPNFNYSKYLEETIQSVLNQDFTDFEIIIVDNASTDCSWELIETFTDIRIKSSRNNYNIGFAPNLQAATEQATGRFINLLSADDKMKPGALKKYADKILKEKNQSNLFIFSDIEYIDEKSIIFGYEGRDLIHYTSKHYDLNSYKSDPNDFELTGHELLKRVLGLLKNPAPFLSVVVSRELWTQVSGYNAIRTIGPDKFFNYKVLSFNPKVIYIKSPQFSYRIHRTLNAQAQKSNVKQQIDDYLNLLDFANLFKELNIEYKVGISAYLNRVCFKTGIQSLLSKNKTQSWRMLGSMLFFPKQAFRSYKFYLLAILNIFYPLSYYCLILSNNIRKRF